MYTIYQNYKLISNETLITQLFKSHGEFRFIKMVTLISITDIILRL